ncbi:MAG: coproporphyrinogen dehydrogenase HemZ [Oscillospiraceae bacterium]|jgi:oxygen-independent coproporphyrinogen-3 oxidase|nr:coproporphyrinogen dehydrogenase HemZ [Oscillospiraceae bacterium]
MKQETTVPLIMQTVWGTLTGIRPAKVAAKLLLSGKSNNETAEILTTEYKVAPDRAEMCVVTAQKAILLKSTLTPLDVALYIGIPFCPTRCAYCSFVSNNVEKSFNLVEPFVNTLIDEINQMAETVNRLGLRVIAVYIGGGTPTALPPTGLERIIKTIEKSFVFSSLREYTIEAGRPDTITEEIVNIIKNSKCTRVCINPQSMSASVLQTIGRKHTPKDTEKAVELLRETKTALNMDIIAGLPSDTPDGFNKTLDSVLKLKPENITIHTLSLKKGSSIMLNNTVIPSSDEVGNMLNYASSRLQKKGYEPYYIYRQKYIAGGFENTGWSLPKYDGVYNICMMEELCTVLAVGGGGVTKLVSQDNRIERIFNAKYPKEYTDRTEKITNKFKEIENFYLN